MAISICSILSTAYLSSKTCTRMSCATRWNERDALSTRAILSSRTIRSACSSPDAVAQSPEAMPAASPMIQNGKTLTRSIQNQKVV